MTAAAAAAAARRREGTSNTIAPPESGPVRHRSRRLISREAYKMESRPLRLCGIGQLFTEFFPDARVPRVEVIHPQPRRAVKVPTMFDCVGSLPSMTKCILPVRQEDHNNLDFFDAFLDKDEAADDQTVFFCGSPPVRTTNPIVWDAFFAKENIGFSPPTTIHQSRTQARVEQSPRSCSSSFDKRTDSLVMIYS